MQSDTAGVNVEKHCSVADLPLGEGGRAPRHSAPGAEGKWQRDAVSARPLSLAPKGLQSGAWHVGGNG